MATYAILKTVDALLAVPTLGFYPVVLVAVVASVG
jgi:ABC-type anion transport system duplicated permease subunit